VNNPRLRQMAESFGGGGGGMPDMASLMNDPSISEMYVYALSGLLIYPIHENLLLTEPLSGQEI